MKPQSKVSVMLTITRADADALELVLQRALEDWYAYLDSGHGPADFSAPGEWRAHKRLNNSALAAVTKLLDKALCTLDFAEEFARREESGHGV